MITRGREFISCAAWPACEGGKGHRRVVEPHAYGRDEDGDEIIRCYQVAGGSASGEDLSTPDLLRNMAAAMGRSARLVPVPVPLLRLAGSALGKRAEIDRLVGSLQIDSSHTRQVLGWTPPVSVQEGIRRMVQGA